MITCSAPRPASGSGSASTKLTSRELDTARDTSSMVTVTVVILERCVLSI